MPQRLSMLDISEPLLAAQKFKANQLSIKDAQQTISDRKTMRDIRGKMVTKNTLGSPELDQMFTIDPANAMAVSQTVAKIKAMNTPKTIIGELEKNRLLQGFAQVSDTEDKWKENLQYLAKNGIKIDTIGDFSPENRALLLGITGKVEQEAEAKLEEIAVGGGKFRKGFVKPGGGDPEFVGEAYSKGTKDGGPKTADARFFNRAAHQYFGGTVNPNTGEFSALDPTTENQKAVLAQRAAQIFQEGAGQINQNDAWNQAVQESQGQGGTGTQQPGQADQLNIRQWLQNQ